jgi:hypothetical protein
LSALAFAIIGMTVLLATLLGAFITVTVQGGDSGDLGTAAAAAGAALAGLATAEVVRSRGDRQ